MKSDDDATIDAGGLDETAGEDVQSGDIARADDGQREDAGMTFDAPAIDAGVVDVLGADAGGQGFLCGDVVCADDTSEYCLTVLGGCIPLGGACQTNVDCCTGACLGGICNVPGTDGGVAGDAGPNASHSCAALPIDCRTSPPTCACVLAHQPCVIGPVLACATDGGVVDVTCGGE